MLDNNLSPRPIYDNLGVGWTVCVSPGPHQYLFASNSNPNGNMPGTWEITGEIYKMELDGTILGRFGHASKEFGGFQVVHMMDCRNPNEIVVGEIESWRVQKLILKPQAAQAVTRENAQHNIRVEENSMKRLLPLLLTAAGAWSPRPPWRRRRCPKSRSIPRPIALQLPDDIYLGEVAGVATNSKGDIFVYTRTGHPTITLGTRAPSPMAARGCSSSTAPASSCARSARTSTASCSPQQVRIDPQDNIWVVDQMTNMVIKFDPDGRVADAARPQGGSGPDSGAAAARPADGAGGAPGAGEQTDLFDRPTDVAWDARRQHLRRRRARQRPRRQVRQERHVRQILGREGHRARASSAPPARSRSTPSGNVYVADGGNKRIQVFDSDGNFKTAVHQRGQPAGALHHARTEPGALQLELQSAQRHRRGGEIYKMQLDGTVIGKFGRAGKLPKEFGTVNAIDCRNENTLYVGEIGNLRVQKLTLK